MNELRPRDWVLLLSATIGFGVLTWLEAYGITELGRGTTNTPRWIMLLIGSMFIAAGLVILFRVRGRLNDLFAFAIIASMGVIFGWIALCGDEGGFSGGGALASRITGVPFDRAMFGLGAMLCLAGATYAFVRFVRQT